MKKINKKDLIIYIIIFAITCIIFLPLLTGHYASDSYNIYNIGYHDYAIKYSLNDGRIFMAILGLIANQINISIDSYIFITLFFALLISNVTIMVLRNVIQKYKKIENIIQEIVVIIISYITVFNFMYLENMYFVECIVMSVSVLLFIISANILVEKKNKYFIKSLILTIIGIMFYQGTIGMFFAFVFLFTILKNNGNIKQIIIDFIQGIFVAGIAVAVNLVLVKIIGKILEMDQSRYGKLSNIPKNIKYIISTLPLIMQKNCGLFPQNVLFIFLTMLTTIIIIYQAKNIKGDNILYKFIAIIFMTIASGFIIHLMTLANYFYTGRLKNSLGALIGIIFIFLYVKTDFLENKNILNRITLIVLLTYTIINIFNYGSIFLQHKETNRLEKIEVQEIEQYISEYEKNSGIKVDKIKKIKIKNRLNNLYFSTIKNKSIFTQNSIRLDWASNGILNFYMNRDLENTQVTKEEEQYYMQNRDEPKGYKCIDNILYIEVYWF